MNIMNHSGYDDVGKLLLRISVGGLMLFHGTTKLMHGIEPIVGMVKAHHLPESLAYGVYVGEVAAPLLILIGFWTRPAALIFAVNLLVAVWLAHRGMVFTLNSTGGWALELQGLYIFGAAAIFFLGGGRYSVDGRCSRHISA